MKVLVTGATGFVGVALSHQLSRAGFSTRGTCRSAAPSAPGLVAVGEIGPDTDWRDALDGIDVVVHLAARTHVLRDTAANPLGEYRRVNVEGTRCLANAAREAGVRRIVFLSSIKVNGERTDSRPFTESDEPRPEDAYGISKLEAERLKFFHYRLLLLNSLEPLPEAIVPLYSSAGSGSILESSLRLRGSNSPQRGTRAPVFGMSAVSA